MSKYNLKNYHPYLVLFLLGNCIVMGIEKRIFENFPFDYQNLIKVFPISAITFILSYVINGLIPSEFKAKIIFFRWNNPLPGTRLLKTIRLDSRFSINDITESFGPIPERAEEQNIYWYNKIYKPVQNTDKVQEVQRSFLLTRDLTIIRSQFHNSKPLI